MRKGSRAEKAGGPTTNRPVSAVRQTSSGPRLLASQHIPTTGTGPELRCPENPNHLVGRGLHFAAPASRPVRPRGFRSVAISRLLEMISLRETLMVESGQLQTS